MLDEADQMFDMGFLPDIRRILQHLPRQRQTLLFGATMPDEIRALAREILVDPVTVQVGKTAPVATVSHAIYPVQQHLKTPLLLKLLRQTQAGSVLVFTRTKHRAKRLGEQLSRAGYQATSLQGDLPQNRRQEAMEGFRDGSYRILAATDIAARGIDVSRVSHVINYDIPDTAETLHSPHRPHRSGLSDGGRLYPRNPRGRRNGAVHRAAAQQTPGAADLDRFRLRSPGAGLERECGGQLRVPKPPAACGGEIRFYRSERKKPRSRKSFSPLGRV